MAKIPKNQIRKIPQNTISNYQTENNFMLDKCTKRTHILSKGENQQFQINMYS